MSKLGVFGGSFNPVHVGHLILAQVVRERCALDRVLFVVAGRPPHKPDRPLASAEHRLNMARLAVEGNPAFEVSGLELDRDGPSYTLLTYRRLKDENPGSECRLILGADSVLDLPNWWHAGELVEEAELIVVERPGEPLSDLSALEVALGAAIVEKVRRSVVAAPLIGVSATEVRERVRSGLSIRYMVPEAVRRYIAENGLYAG